VTDREKLLLTIIVSLMLIIAVKALGIP